MPQIIWIKQDGNWVFPLINDYQLWRSADGHEIRLERQGRAIAIDWCKTEYELEKRAEELARDVYSRSRAVSEN